MPTMPNIVGRDLQDATAMLEAAGVIDLAQIGYFGTWPLNIDWVTDPSQAPNTVIAQYPYLGPRFNSPEFFSTTTAGDIYSALLSTSAGSSEASICAFSQNKTGWGLVGTSVGGTPPPFAFSSQEPPPVGYGFYLPAGGGVAPQTFCSGIVSAVITVTVSGSDITADFYARFWKVDPSTGVFTLFAKILYSNVSLTNGNLRTLTFWSAVIENAVWFSEVDELFVDIVANVTSTTAETGPPEIILGGSFNTSLSFVLQQNSLAQVDVNPEINLTVSSLPVSVIYP